MLMVTTEDLKPGSVLLPVQTEICPSHSNRSSYALESSPLALPRGLLCTEWQAISMAVGLALPWFCQTHWELERHAEAIA